MTRVCAGSQNQIDNFFSNIPLHRILSEVSITHLSDHYAQKLTVSVDINNKSTYIEKRFVSSINIERFRKCLQNELWHDVMLALDVDSKYDCFFNIHFDHFNNSFPISKCRPRRTDGWMNAQIKAYGKYVKVLHVTYPMTNSHYHQIYKSEKSKYQKYISE